MRLQANIQWQKTAVSLKLNQRVRSEEEVESIQSRGLGTCTQQVVYLLLVNYF
jgi:hypothetical protein